MSTSSEPNIVSAEFKRDPFTFLFHLRKSEPDKATWWNTHSFYEVDEGFRDELFERFLSPALREQFFRTKGETRATVDARLAKRQSLRIKVFCLVGAMISLTASISLLRPNSFLSATS